MVSGAGAAGQVLHVLQRHVLGEQICEHKDGPALDELTVGDLICKLYGLTKGLFSQSSVKYIVCLTQNLYALGDLVMKGNIRDVKGPLKTILDRVAQRKLDAGPKHRPGGKRLIVESGMMRMFALGVRMGLVGAAVAMIVAMTFLAQVPESDIDGPRVAAKSMVGEGNPDSATPPFG